VITGVSFRGAGTIIRHRSDDQVEGLTTAASILLATALGICVALSRLALAVGVTILALITLRGVNVLARWLERRRN
jgi:putative Mg2+ transporter-C (MgtC) family protein